MWEFFEEVTVNYMKKNQYPKRINSTNYNYYAPLSPYEECISDLMDNGVLSGLTDYQQHGDYTRLDHCFNVSHRSYKVCKHLGLDARAAARGGLLHDFFLYDWRTTKVEEGMHAFAHPRVALRTANEHFDLTKKESDIIVKHMWPLTLRFPRYWESLIVTFVDKYCAAGEAMGYWRRMLWRRSKSLLRIAD